MTDHERTPVDPARTDGKPLTAEQRVPIASAADQQPPRPPHADEKLEDAERERAVADATDTRVEPEPLVFEPNPRVIATNGWPVALVRLNPVERIVMHLADERELALVEAPLTEPSTGELPATMEQAEAFLAARVMELPDPKTPANFDANRVTLVTMRPPVAQRLRGQQRILIMVGLHVLERTHRVSSSERQHVDLDP